MAVDLSPFARQRTVLDYQQLQEAFEAQKTQQALQNMALIKQATGGITPQEQFDMQFKLMQLAQQDENADATREQSRQNNEVNQDLRRLQIDTTAGTAAAARAADERARQDKKDAARREAQSAVTGALSSLDQQIAQGQALFGDVDEKGNEIARPMSGLLRNFGTLDSFLPTVPGTEAADAAAKLDTLRSGTLLSGVVNLKNSGVSLAPFSNFEGQTVQQATASLQPGQSEESIIKNGREYINKLKQDKIKLQQNFEAQYGTGKVSMTAAIDRDAALAEARRRGLIK